MNSWYKTAQAATILAVMFAPALPAIAQIGLPTLSQPIPNQFVASGPVLLDLRNHFGLPGVTGQVVQFATSAGRINVELRATEAPRHVANFLSYVSRSAYDNTIIHRVDNMGGLVPAIVQGGGYQAASFVTAPPAIARSASVALEYGLPNIRGTLAAARNASDRDGATSEWFFNSIDNSETLGPSNHGGYTVFGHVLGTGMTIVDAIAQTPTFNLGTSGFGQIPLRNYSPTQSEVTTSNLIVVNSVRAIPIYPPALGDPTAVLSFAATSTAPAVVTATVSGSTLTLTPRGPGSASVSVQARDANGNASATTTFAVTIPSDALFAPIFTAQPASQVAAAGGTVVLSTSASGGNVFFPITYRWLWNGAPLSAANSPFLVLKSVTAANAGAYSCVATNAAGSTISSAATVTVVAANAADEGRLVNLSIRTFAGTLDDTLIVGFAIGGNATMEAKPLLVRAVGPSLEQFGVNNALDDPVMSLYQGQTSTAANDNWAGDAQIANRSQRVGAFALPSSTSLDAALALSATPGSYTAQIRGKDGATGTALAEIYDASESFGATTPRLNNASARGHVGAGGDLLTVGFVVGGTTPVTVLIRAIGPTLADFGIVGALVDPTLRLYRGPVLIRENDDWGGDFQLDAVVNGSGAFPISDKASKDAMLLVTLAPGAYTAQVSGKNENTGVALVELYEVR